MRTGYEDANDGKHDKRCGWTPCRNRWLDGKPPDDRRHLMAVVAYDPAKANVAELMEATANVGYPSSVIVE